VVLAGGPDREGGGDGPLLLLMHGYGAPGEDLVPLARQLGVGPAVRFAFPAAPLVLEMGGAPEHAGRAWWPIDMGELQRAVAQKDFDTLTGRTPVGLSEARDHITALLDALEKDHGVTRKKLVLGGFSQGAMLATDIVSGGDLQHPHCAQFSIDGNLGQVRAKSEDGIRSALAVFIQRAGGRIESCLAGKHVAVLIQRQVPQGKRALSEIVLLIVLSNSNATIFENNAGALASICQPQDGTPQFRSRHLGGFSRDEGLA